MNGCSCWYILMLEKGVLARSEKGSWPLPPPHLYRPTLQSEGLEWQAYFKEASFFLKTIQIKIFLTHSLHFVFFRTPWFRSVICFLVHLLVSRFINRILSIFVLNFGDLDIFYWANYENREAQRKREGKTNKSESHAASDPIHVTGKRVLKGHDNETILVHFLNQLLIHFQSNYEIIRAHKKTGHEAEHIGLLVDHVLDSDSRARTDWVWVCML